MNQIIISVIIPTYQDWSRLAKCLNALANQTFSEHNFEILVMNNDPYSTKPEGLVLADNATVHMEPKAGSYAARNSGAKLAKGKFLAFTDSDCIPDAGWLENGLKYLANGCQLVGGKIIFHKEKHTDSKLAFEFERAFSFNQKRNITQGKFSVTANLMTTKQIFETVGDFLENSYSGGDSEWSKRASHSGFRLVYADDVIITHPSRNSIASLVAKKRRTSGGYFILSYQSKTFVGKVLDLFYLVRPPVKVLIMSCFSPGMKLEMFLLKWYLEWVGAFELVNLSFSSGDRKRS